MSMNPKDRLTLQLNYKGLIEINYSVISAQLISSLIIDLDMHADIQSYPTERKKMEKLLLLLPSRGARAMKEFINAVRPSYNWIASKLEEDGVVSEFNLNGNNNLNCSNILRHSTFLSSNSNNRAENNLENLKDMSISGYVRPIQKIMQKSITLCRNWLMLAHAMGLEANVVTDIQREMSNSGGVAYAIHATCQAWVSKCGPSKATFGSLVQILESEDVNEVSEALIELWTTLQK